MQGLPVARNAIRLMHALEHLYAALSAFKATVHKLTLGDWICGSRSQVAQSSSNNNDALLS